MVQDITYRILKIDIQLNAQNIWPKQKMSTLMQICLDYT